VLHQLFELVLRAVRREVRDLGFEGDDEIRGGIDDARAKS
jgi:hypothetical protein